MVLFFAVGAGAAHGNKACRSRHAGTAVLLVEQDAGATLAIADRVYVMEHGKFARAGTPKELAADDEIRKVYLGV